MLDPANPLNNMANHFYRHSDTISDLERNAGFLMEKLDEYVQDNSPAARIPLLDKTRIFPVPSEPNSSPAPRNVIKSVHISKAIQPTSSGQDTPIETITSLATPCQPPNVASDISVLSQKHPKVVYCERQSEIKVSESDSCQSNPCSDQSTIKSGKLNNVARSPFSPIEFFSLNSDWHIFYCIHPGKWMVSVQRGGRWPDESTWHMMKGLKIPENAIENQHLSLTSMRWSKLFDRSQSLDCVAKNARVFIEQYIVRDKVEWIDPPKGAKKLVREESGEGSCLGKQPGEMLRESTNIQPLEESKLVPANSGQVEQMASNSDNQLGAQVDGACSSASGPAAQTDSDLPHETPYTFEMAHVFHQIPCNYNLIQLGVFFDSVV